MPPTLVNYLTQISTYTGLIKLACALGLFTATPEIQNQMSAAAVQFVTGVLALVGAIDLLRDEKKASNVPNNKPESH